MLVLFIPDKNVDNLNLLQEEFGLLKYSLPAIKMFNKICNGGFLTDQNTASYNVIRDEVKMRP